MLSPVRLSVRPSVRRVDHRKTVEVRIMKFSPYGTQNQADQPSRFFRDSPGLGYSVPESRMLSSGRQNVPVWLQKSRAGHNAIRAFND